MENNDLFPAKKQEAEETKFISEEKPPPPVTTKVAKMEYTDWSPLLKENCEKYLAKQKEEDRKYFSEFLRNKLKRPAVKTNVADNHTPAVTSGTLFVISDPFLAESKFMPFFFLGLMMCFVIAIRRHLKFNTLNRWVHNSGVRLI
ncbi:hypothetical protein MtrunA17_Chr1g0178261 [Medicago truncatula]|uniref:Transmembrane protein n=1 Tax=Medicago truncatula TaxID=3880 RepID=A0A396JQ09_MEDTR|nr:hypothetical protein MtrunA17_Chr1g0178261 [Medicago truncatula]